MKKIILLIIALNSTFAQAQYFQRYFNFDIGTANYKPEVLYDGLCSRYNYSGGNFTNYFNVGVGFTKVSEVPGTGLYNELRFVKTDKGGGAVLQNNGYALADKLTTAWFNSEGHAICEIDNGLGTGGFMVVGKVASNDTTGAVAPGGSDALIARITNTGSMPNRWRFNFGAADELNCVIASKFNPGYFYACGISLGTGSAKVIVMKFNSMAVLVWANTYHFDDFTPGTIINDCKAYGIAEDATTGNLFVVGSYQADGSPSGTDGLIVKFSAAGAVLSAIHHDLASDDQYRAIKPTADGNFIICGYSNKMAAGTSSYDFWLTKIDPTGGILFSNILRQPNSTSFGLDVIERIDTAGTADYFITGSRYQPGGTFNSICKTDNLGNGISCASYASLVSYNYHFMGIDYADATMTSQGVRVFSNVFTSLSRSDSYIFKTYFNLATCTNFCPFETPITFPQIVNTGVLEYNKNATVSKKNLDILQTKFKSASICSQGSIACGSNAKTDGDFVNDELAEDIDLSVFPNPASQTMQIEFRLPVESTVSMFITDLSGRKVKLVFNNEKFAAGSHQVELLCTDLPTGVYQCILVQNDQLKYLKLVIEH